MPPTIVEPSAPENRSAQEGSPVDLRVVEHTSLDSLSRLAARWSELGRQVPFRTWEWLSTWWHHYGRPAPKERIAPRLSCLEVCNGQGNTLAIAPWYGRWSPARGWVVRFLGSGEVCSDYLSVLCEPGWEPQVSTLLAEWLVQRAESPRGERQGRPPTTDHSPGIPAWDLLELDGFDAGDQVMRHLAEALRQRGVAVHWEPGPSCWRIVLPDSWEEYLATRMSRNQRKQLRRLERNLVKSGRVTFHHVVHESDLPEATRILVDLHQRRHEFLGRPGCFASPRYTAFHLEVIPAMLRAGRLLMAWSYLDGEPAAIEYTMLGDDAIYFYQGGMDPEKAHASPGRVMTMLMLQHVIECGYRAFDFLRGDETYKAHWRAEPRPSAVLRAVPPRGVARLRYGAWALARGAKRCIRRSLRPLGRRESEP